MGAHSLLKRESLGEGKCQAGTSQETEGLDLHGCNLVLK